MALMAVRPTKHPKSRVYRVRLSIPASLRETAGKLYKGRYELVETLRTKDPAEARRRAPAAIARLRAKLDTIEAARRGDPTIAVSDRDAAALAGEWYRRRMTEDGDNPGRSLDWEMWDNVLDEQIDLEPNSDGSREVITSDEDRADATALLKAHGRPTDPAAASGRWARGDPCSCPAEPTQGGAWTSSPTL